MRHWWLLLLCAVLALLSPLQALAASSPFTVAVLPFAKQSGDRKVWLDKAIADLVAQKLAESPNYAVLNRDALQTFLKEMQLQESGFTGETASRVGKIAKMQQVVFGMYAVESSHITLQMTLMEVETQTTLGKFQAEGELAQLISLTEKLVKQLLASSKVELTPDQSTHIAFTPTDSLSALEHFYDGIKAYDDGNYEQAMADFFAATKQDPHYLDAHVWFARMLEQLGKPEQAVISYKKLAKIAQGSIEAIDAQYFAARLLAKSNPQQAIALLHPLTQIHPEIPETLEAAYLEASLKRQLGDIAGAYTLYQQIDDYSEKYRKHITAFEQKRELEEISLMQKLQHWWNNTTPANGAINDDVQQIAGAGVRHSRFFNWEHPLGLYREAITAMVEMYPLLPAPQAGSPTWSPPRGSFVVDVNHPVIEGDVKQKDKSLFGGDHSFTDHWSEMFYALIIPKGYVASGIDLEITGNLATPDESKDFTLRVMPFPLRENYQNSWLGVIFGQTVKTTTLTKHVPFFGQEHALLALQLVENYGKIDHWKVTVQLKPESGAASVRKTQSHGQGTDGELLAKIHLGEPEKRIVRTQPQYIMQWLPKQKLALASNNGLWLVGVTGDLLTQETNLWQSYSLDGGKNWSPSEPLPVNSASQEFAPTLIRREDGLLQLFFLSDRRGMGWELWTSTQDKVSHRWTHARLVPLRDVAETGLENSQQIDVLLPYSVIQDNHGRWQLVFYSRATQRVHFLMSEDLERWSPTGELPLSHVASLAMGQDLTGRYYLTVAGFTKPLIYTSNDAATWNHTATLARNYSDPRAIANYPMTYVPGHNEVTLLFSDVYTGLQYARLGADSATTPDLVTQSALDTFAATQVSDGIITAQWKDDNVHIQHFSHLAFEQNPVNPTSELIYTERTRDDKGGLWNRIFARERYRVPDVTAIASAANGRIWWGIETGIMALRDKDFFLSDVSDGFFYHYVDQIRPCGDMIWFASSMLNPARVGYNHGDEPNRSSLGKSIALPELEGAVRTTACGDSKILFTASANKIARLKAEAPPQYFSLPPEAKATVTALAYNDADKRLLIGTHTGAVYSLTDDNIALWQQFAKPIDAIAAKNGILWIALHNDGLVALNGKGNTLAQHSISKTLVNFGKLLPDGKGGIWAMADPYSASPGLLHATLKDISIHNPPQTTLSEIVDIALAPDNTLWIGTNIDGIYYYRSTP